MKKLTNPISLALLVLTACVVTSCTVTGSSSSTSDGSSTAGVQCDYNYSALNSSASVNLTSTSKWSCSSTTRTLAGNGVPDHEVGTFPNTDNPNTISAQTASATYTLSPVATATALGGPSGALGYALNSVKFDPDTGGTCNDDGSSCSLIGGTGNWRMEALGQKSFNFGADSSNAHVQPTGEYHYHGLPEGFVTKLNKGKAMTLIGWAADGFPIYARYGYATATDATSSIKVLTGS